MKFYRCTTKYSCGIDLHSRQMYMCVMDREGNKLVHTNVMGNDWEYFLSRIKPYRDDLTVCCECTFNWYWLADKCAEEGLTFMLAHALYVKAIHGGKNKNDRIDSEKLAHLLRSNLIPPAYVYPAARRSTRDLLRRRTSFVWKRSEIQGHLTCMPLVQGQDWRERAAHASQSLILGVLQSFLVSNAVLTVFPTRARVGNYRGATCSAVIQSSRQAVR